MKIENQTLNEKIEERNEELQQCPEEDDVIIVVILSHTREMEYGAEEDSLQQEKLNELADQLNSEKNYSSKNKKLREKLWK